MVYTILYMDNKENIDTLSLAQTNALKREIMDTNLKVSKLRRTKNNRLVIGTFGAILLGFYAFLYASASAATVSNPASVSFLGPIFLFPIVLLGILFIILGISGVFIIQSKIDKCEKHIRLLNDSIKD
jgi:hypothetical protein